MSNEFHHYLLKLNEYTRKITLEKSLAVNVEELEQRWSKYSKEFDFEFDRLLLSTDNNFLQIKLHNNKNIALFGDIIEFNEEKIIKNINMIARGDGTPQSGAHMFIAIGILIDCFNPYEGVEFRKKLLKDLGILEVTIGMKNTVIINGLKYTVNFSKELGLMFIISRLEQ